MRKKLVVSLVCLVAITSILFMPMFMAEARKHKYNPLRVASGTWTYIPTDMLLKEQNDYTFILGWETGVWTGTFEGTSEDVFFAEKNPDGTLVYLPYGVIFFTGTVNGKEGTLRINFGPGVKKGDPMEWSGAWRILSGTGELENLRGRGVWWQVEPQHLEYKGWIRFKLNKNEE